MNKQLSAFLMMFLVSGMILGGKPGLVFAEEKEVAGVEAPVNVNKGDKDQLLQIQGVGPILAERIIQYREANGAFKSVEDLLLVNGIGENKFAKIKSQITV